MPVDDLLDTLAGRKKTRRSRNFTDGASRARTGDLLGAIQALSHTEL